MSHGQHGDNQNHERAEKVSPSDRAEKRASQKAGGEASGSMEDLNKSVVANIQEKRASRSSGATKDGFVSADSLLPKEKKQKRIEQKTEEKPEQKGPEKTETITDKATKAAQQVFESVYKAGTIGIAETGKFLKGMGDGEREFVEETGKSLAVAKDYYGQAFKGKVNLGADIKEFTSAIGQTLGTAGDYYINQVPKGQASLGKDISETGKAASDHWNSLDTEHKGKFFGKEVVPLLVPGAVGVVAKDIEAANLTGKASQAIAAFAGSEKMMELEQKLTAIQSKVQQMQELAKPLQPAYATASEAPGRRPIAPIEAPRPDDHILMMKGDKGLPQGIKPSEKVHVSRTVDAKAVVSHKIDVPEEVLKAAEKQGLDRVTAQEKLQKVAESIKNAYYQIGDYDPKIHGTERAYGNRFHEVLRENLNKQADPLVHTEASYLKGSQSEWGKLGTSRVDISLGEKNEPFASLCLKTLKAIPSAQQERGWVRNLPKLKDGTTPPRLHVKLPPGADE